MEAADKKGTDTRERLIQAAGEVFAQRGFKGATVREISRQANANIAAVNYHFGDKEELYYEVLKNSLSSVLEKYPPDLGVTPESTPEERLHAFIRSLLFRVLDESRPTWHARLMAREIAEPTAALDQMIENILGPLYGYLTMVVKQLISDEANDELVHNCMFSIMGQCLFYHNARHVISKLYHKKFGPEVIERLSTHIMRFSLGAMKDLGILDTSHAKANYISSQ
ncbi:MAG: CerR family C-terminal domain-containing protein [Deltaproteobacteria bacterium]|nr:CerR family C-terminal domain-containing protein [Deltaproteobacteria bacterium]